MKKLILSALLLAGMVSVKAQTANVESIVIDKNYNTNLGAGPAAEISGSDIIFKHSPITGAKPEFKIQFRGDDLSNYLMMGFEGSSSLLKFYPAGYPYGWGKNDAMEVNGDFYAGNVFFKNTKSDYVYIGNGDFPTVKSANPDYRLFVEDGIVTEEVLVELKSNWADYVFANDYELMTLEETESFISENKHLPGIPSAKEVEGNGLSLGEMSVKQMEKIEELTLHLIQVNKEKEELESRVERLEALLLNK